MNTLVPLERDQVIKGTEVALVRRAYFGGPAVMERSSMIKRAL
jgi:hypothetical protein